MNKDETIKYFIKEKIIREKDGEYFLVKKRTSIIQQCKNLPEKYIGVSISQAMNFFFSDSEIPAFTSGELSYSLRSITKESLKVFEKIIANKSIDFSILVVKTLKYYKAKNTTKPKLSKYFTEGTWRQVYESYETPLEDKGNSTWL